MYCNIYFIALLCLYFSVMELKLLPPLVLWGLYFLSSFFLLLLYNLIFFGENYLASIVYAGAKLVFMLVWKVPWIALLSYSLLFLWSMLFVSMKAFLTVSMMVGNFIDVYILGIMAVIMSIVVYIIIYGILILSLWLFIFLSALLMFLFMLGLLELFSTLFQSLTLSNRLSINMLCGSLLTSMLCSFLYSMFLITYLALLYVLLSSFTFLFLFECVNSMVQCIMFNILSFNYIML